MIEASNSDSVPPPPMDPDAPLGQRCEWTMAEYGETFGMSAELVKDRLRACRPPAAEKRGGRWYVTIGHLRRTFDGSWPEIVARLWHADAARARRKERARAIKRRQRQRAPSPP